MDGKDKEVNIAQVPEWNRLSLDGYNPWFFEESKKVISNEDIPEAGSKSQPQDDHNTEQTPEMFDSYIDMEVALPRGLDGGLFHAKVKRREMDRARNPIGEETNNPIIDTRLYEVEYIDETIDTAAENAIAINILSEVHEEGHR